MTFFYDLNKKIADLSKPAEQLNERSEKWIQKAVDPSHKGDLHKALNVPQGEKIPKGKIEKATHSKNAHLRHMAQFAKNVAKEDAVEEGFVDTVKQGAQAALGAIGQTLGHGSDEDMIKDLQKKAGVPVTGKVQPQQPGQQPTGQQPTPMAEDDMDEAMFPGSKIGDKLRGMKQNAAFYGDALKAGMMAAPAAGAGAAGGAAMGAAGGAGAAALFAPALGAGALGGAAAALGGFLTYKGLNWLAQKLFGTKEEALEFATAHLKAANAGQPQFTFQGKTYPVKVKSPQEARDLYDKVRNLQSQIHEGTLDEEGGEPMTAKQKAFAKLAPPADKITFADKIAGAKKEVDEMLGDVAAEAMKNALKGHQQVADEGNAFTAKLKATPKGGKFKMGNKEYTDTSDVDEGWDDMMADVKKRRASKVGDVEHGAKHDIEHTATGRKVTRRVDDKGISVGADDDKPADGEKRGRGRPKKADKAPERVTAKAYKHKGGRKMSKEEIEEAIASLEECGYQVSPLKEKAVSVAQRRAAGIAHAAQKGEIPKSELKGASKEMAKMPKGELHKFAATKEKGLPKKKEKTEESGTVAGSVAPAEGGKGKSKGVVGKGIYDSLNRQLEDMIAESMNVSVNMSVDEHGEPHKNITVSAEGDEAEHLAQLLNLAGVSAKSHDEGEICPACGSADCHCDEMVDENAPDWPTEPETTGGDDPNMTRWAGGLNKPKETGQTTIPVVNRDPRRGSFGPAEHAVDVREEKDLGMKLYAELKGFKG